MHFLSLNWAEQQPHARLFMFYLLVVTCFAVVRSIQLARRLYSRDNSPRSSEDSRYLNFLATCDADITSIRRLVPLTLGISLLVVIYGAFPTWNDEYSTSRMTGYQAGFRALDVLFARFSLGLFVSILLYSLASFFRSIVTRRKIKSQLS